jgi:hypothetical protein
MRPPEPPTRQERLRRCVAQLRGRVERVRADIERYGLHVTGVIPTANADLPYPFTYTTALEVPYGHPELLVVGIPPELAHQVINAAVAQIKEGKRYGEGTHDVLQGFPVYARRVPDDPDTYDELFGECVRACGGRDFDVLQLVLPDKQRRFPWDPDCGPAYVRTQNGEGLGVSLAPVPPGEKPD